MAGSWGFREKTERRFITVLEELAETFQRGCWETKKKHLDLSRKVMGSVGNVAAGSQ